MLPVQADPQADAYSVPLSEFDVSNPHLYQDDTWRPWFERLRREDPVHKCENGIYGAYWSVTRYRDIMAVETNQHAFSSDARWAASCCGPAVINGGRASFRWIRRSMMSSGRRSSPIVAPGNLAKMAETIRERPARAGFAAAGRDLRLGRPRLGRADDEMLATLFDFPFEERRKLTYWSNNATVNTRAGTGGTRNKSAMRCSTRLTAISTRCGTSGRTSRRGRT